MDKIDITDIIEMYIDKFGESPEFGPMDFDKQYPIDAVIDAINSGKPIKVEDYPKDRVY